eukprot:CAMPEP_0175046658 /NCGR_PEP_ID=MMETSP0052_2-20121109/5152_1 /TAXON_ID=51329 ORGANISM="Polytomella parva, Strain SAG 63-3" /NCGR_SAMPLE_ID=MMETSP0052_2 /ASSEMBLY_ACC=CAM_ASM_000194 /LENGTH=366 /DNA_ID=CAMNT_0016310427 /DNA_START=40 /DNA_END=1137 /DNA_ORIENTATION=+
MSPPLTPSNLKHPHPTNPPSQSHGSFSAPSPASFIASSSHRNPLSPSTALHGGVPSHLPSPLNPNHNSHLSHTSPNTPSLSNISNHPTSSMTLGPSPAFLSASSFSSPSSPAAAFNTPPPLTSAKKSSHRILALSTHVLEHHLVLESGSVPSRPGLNLHHNYPSSAGMPLMTLSKTREWDSIDTKNIAIEDGIASSHHTLVLVSPSGKAPALLTRGGAQPGPLPGAYIARSPSPPPPLVDPDLLRAERWGESGSRISNSNSSVSVSHGTHHEDGSNANNAEIQKSKAGTAAAAAMSPFAWQDASVAAAGRPNNITHNSSNITNNNNNKDNQGKARQASLPLPSEQPQQLRRVSNGFGEVPTQINSS